MFPAFVLSLIVQSSPGPGGGATPAPLPTTAASAVFENSGSTNLTGYSIAVEPDGHATVSAGGKLTTSTVQAATVKTLFAQLAAAGPLDQLPVERCMKSASFGSSTYIAWHGKRSPDLSCGAGPAASNLMETFGQIKLQLHVEPVVRSHAAPTANP